MSLKPKAYKKRVIDDVIAETLEIFPAISIEGPKWCGKTWAALKHANSVRYFDNPNTQEAARSDIFSILNEKHPLLVDEWTYVPKVWDAIRHKCDEDSEKGKFIITCSTTLSISEAMSQVHHTGAGRIEKLKMYPMSLYESGDSCGKISIKKLYENGEFESGSIKAPTIDKIAYYIVRGGWPDNISTSPARCMRMPRSYINTIVFDEMSKEKRRNSNRMKQVLASLARRESAPAGAPTIAKDISETREEGDLEISRVTVDDYIDVLSRLHAIEDQPAFDTNYRASAKVGVSPIRHFVDPSLACAVLNLDIGKLKADMRTFGLFFEGLAIRDLRVYMSAMYGTVSHFRDNTSGDEVDAILEFENGDYAAIEIKLNADSVKYGINDLKKFYEAAKIKPKFMMVLVGIGEFIYQEDGIYVVPITALKP